MSRRNVAAKRETLPDPKYNDVMLAKFINHVMRRGKKSLAERIVYGALDVVKVRTSEDALEIFKRALENVGPRVEVKSKRMGGATYQVPVEVRESRRIALAMRWLVECARVRRDKTMAQRLANELIEAANQRGGAVRRCEEMRRMAEANKAFAHYRY
ncbi:MAG: 30S ribosomal protein S7 [Gammaproteobacteria bacterium AqS3]|nr:30S ribosomal protein S7 [Gammaproteobacteria bacterium AqS3]